MNKLKKFLGSKKVFFLGLFPSVVVEIFTYLEYLGRKKQPYDGCGWVSNGEGCKNYLDYMQGGIGGTEFFIIGHSLFISLSLLLLGAVYFVINKKSKRAIGLFILLLILIVLFLINTGRL
jgi:hypothetical protein